MDAVTAAPDGGSSDDGIRELPFVFTGDAKEYFGIWIVNVLVSVATLGLWAPWAKVRRQRWFYGHTLIDGSPLEYHARGLQILIGRIIFFLVLVGSSLIASWHPEWTWLPFVAFLPFLPFFANRGLRFAARVTGWRGGRFDFRGRFLMALGCFFLVPATYGVTLGLTVPAGVRATRRYIAQSLSFGGLGFDAEMPIGRLWAILGRTYLAGICLLLPLVLAMRAAIVYADTLISPHVRRPELPVYMEVTIGALVVLLVAGVYFQFSIRASNLFFECLTLDGRHRFRSTLSPWRYLWIFASGWAATIATAGLLRPWASVREWRYRTSHRALIAHGPLTGFAVAPARSGRGFFAEYGSSGGIDFGF